MHGPVTGKTVTSATIICHLVKESNSGLTNNNDDGCGGNSGSNNNNDPQASSNSISMCNIKYSSRSINIKNTSN